MEKFQQPGDLLEEVEALRRRIAELEKTEDALRESQRRLSDIINFLPDATLVIDKEGKIIAWNAAMERLTGRNAEEMLGKDDYAYAVPFYGRKRPILIDLVRNGDEKSLKDYYTNLKRRGEILYGESYTPNLKKDAITHLYATASILRNSHGEIDGAIECLRDNTERRLLAEKLIRSERQYRNLVDHTPVGVYQTNLEGKLTFANRALADLLGYDSIDELMSINAFTLYWAEEDRFKLIKKILETNPLSNYELKLRRKDGGLIHILINVVLESDIMSGMIVDVTYRKEMEHALRESEQRFRSLFENSPDACCLIDGSVIVDCNRMAAQTLGYEKKTALIGKEYWELALERQPDGGSSRDKALDALSEAGSKGICRFEWSQSTKKGGIFFAEVTLSTIVIQGKQIIYCTWRDISSRKRTEEENLKLQYQLMQAQKMEAIGTMAGGIAHNFNNLLMGIQGNAELSLMSLEPGHPNLKKLKTIQEMVKSGSSLTRQILGFARGGKYEVQTTDINTLLEKSVSLLNMTKKDIVVTMRLPENVWKAEVDQGQMEQAFLNILINADQAMPEGGELHIETENALLSAKETKPFGVHSGDYIKISVTDMGIGMDKNTLERIFDPFFTTKEPDRGTGLGLSSAYGIVKHHGGFITVHSRPGAGSTFELYLPASKKAVSPLGEIKGKIFRGHETILVVDDEKDIASVTKAMLESLGYEVLTAEGGREAIAVYLAKEGKIDLVIMDMVMPEMSGRKAIEGLLQGDRDLKFILCSGYTVDHHVQKMLGKNCLGFIQKPFHMRELSQIVREALDRVNL